MLNKLRIGTSIKYNPIVLKSKLLLSALLPYQPMKGGKEFLDHEYSQGKWDYLKNIDELSRFSVVIGYCHVFKPGAAKILEIGCGVGLLKHRLCSSQFTRFVGVDISEEAIKRASSELDEKTSFIREDANVFRPNEQFNIIVFNESLEYFDDPAGLVKRYEEFLEKDGIFIISMFVGLDTMRTKRIWKTLDETYPIFAKTRVTTRPDYSWIIKVYQPNAV